MDENVKNLILVAAKPKHDRAAELDEMLVAPEISADVRLYLSLSKERNELSAVYDAYEKHLKISKELLILKKLSPESPEERCLLDEELARLENLAEESLEALKVAVIPASDLDGRRAIMELMAEDSGSGVFLACLIRAYRNFFDRIGIQYDVLEYDGDSEDFSTYTMLEIDDEGGYGFLRRECGIHRAIYGKKGTAKVKVVVLPQENPQDVVINEKDVRIDLFHSSGAGGQNINKVETAVRITHLPTGIAVTCQNERSQLQNRAKAWEILRARLGEYERARLDDKNRKLKKLAKSGTEVIRTYDFTIGAVTDKSGASIALDRALEGKLETLFEALEIDEACRKE